MKNLRRTILAVVATGLLSGGLFCQQAQAVPTNTIDGYINFTGLAQYNTHSLLTATKVTRFKNTVVVGSATTGDFATFTTNGENVAMAHPYTFSPSTPTPGLWS